MNFDGMTISELKSFVSEAQAAGAHDAYRAGDCVTFQGRIYEALISAAVWSPLAYPQAWKGVR